ncbi:MAG: asparagine synthase-related protein [Alphaproteobacteria bacterium]
MKPVITSPPAAAGGTATHGHGWTQFTAGAVHVVHRGEPAAAQIVAAALAAPPCDAQSIATRLVEIAGFYAVIGTGPGGTVGAVDHIRSTPLFYCRGPVTDGQAPVSTDARALTAGQPPFDPDAVREFAMAGYVTGADTLVPAIAQMEAGDVRVWQSGADTSTQASSYRHWPDARDACSPEQARARLSDIADIAFARTITKANGRTIIVPLSGGLDSRLVLAKLAEHGARNLRAFSYGPGRNADAAVAQRVAARLGVEWEFIATGSRGARAALPDVLRQEYGHFADGLCAVPNHQDLLALSVLRQRGRLPADAMIVNGQTGDFVTGGHIPAALMSDETIPLETVITAILDKHYGLWRSLLTPANITAIRARIADRLGIADSATRPVSAAEAAAFFELWEYRERQAKYVVGGQRIYDFLGLDWDLPLWDRDFTAFWRDAPLADKYNQALYRDWLFDWDHTQVFSTISSRITAWPRALSAVLAPVAVATRLLAGRARRDRLFRYLNYFDRFSDHYRMFGFSTFKRHMHDMRNPASLYAREWLEREGVDVDAIARA